MKIYMPICYWCKYYHNVEKRTSFPKCKAFPEAIPEAIWDSEQDHRKPIEGDGSIQFEQVDNINNLPRELEAFLKAADITAETGLRIAFDKLEEKDAWRWDERYPKIKPE